MKKGIIIAGVALVLVGVVFFAIAFVLSGNDITKLGTIKTETNTYSVENGFSRIEIETKETIIAFRLSENAECNVVCVEQEKMKHSVSVVEGVLKIVAVDERNRLERIGFFKKELSMIVSLPSDSYEALTLSAGTGDVVIPAPFSFGKVDISVSTGDVECNAVVSDLCKIKTSTGDVKIRESMANKLDLDISTGNAEIVSYACAGEISIAVSTGKVSLTDVTCKSFFTEGGTGKASMNNLVASETLRVERSTGNVILDNCDAESIFIKTSTGDVSGTLRSEKVFLTKTSTGTISVPDTVTGGRCEITTSTGDITVRIAND